MLHSRRIDPVKAYEEVNLVIRILQHVRMNINGLIMIALLMHIYNLAVKNVVEVMKPRTCKRQQFRQNAKIAVGSKDKEGTPVQYCFNVTASFLDEASENMKCRFDKGHEVVLVGFKLILSCAISEPQLISTLQPFLHVYMYAEDFLFRQTLNAEIDMWMQKLTCCSNQRSKTMQEQHKKALRSR